MAGATAQERTRRAGGTSNSCCSRSTFAGRFLHALSACWRPLKIPPWFQGEFADGPITIGGQRHVGAALEKRLMPRFMAPRGRHEYLPKARTAQRRVARFDGDGG